MTILVTGATGTVGGYVVDQLTQTGQRVRALTRDPMRADLPGGVEVARGELTEPDSIAPALDGVTGLHLITFNAADNTELKTGPEIIELAAAAGVRKVTILSNPDEDHADVTQAAQASGLQWTRLVPLEFMSNTLGWAESIRAEGVVRAFRDPPNAVVHPADIGAVAATALTEDGHDGRATRSLGPRHLLVPRRPASSVTLSAARSSTSN